MRVSKTLTKSVLKKPMEWASFCSPFAGASEDFFNTLFLILKWRAPAL